MQSLARLCSAVKFGVTKLGGITAISGTVGALNSAVSISKALLSLGYNTLFQGKAIEWNGEILSEQHRALDANTGHLALLTQVSDPRRQFKDHNTWNVENVQYRLRQVSSVDSYAFTINNIRVLETDHYTCSICYDRGRRRILQGYAVLDIGQNLYTCLDCSTASCLSGTWPDALFLNPPGNLPLTEV